MSNNDMCLIRRPVQHRTNMGQGESLRLFVRHTGVQAQSRGRCKRGEFYTIRYSQTSCH